MKATLSKLVLMLVTPALERDLNAHSSSNNAKKIFSAIAITLKSSLSYIWDILSTSLSNDPRIWQRRDRFGRVYWQVYDPIRDRTIIFNSEEEVRYWLDQRFYTH
jgi:hypothetical protein